MLPFRVILLALTHHIRAHRLVSKSGGVRNIKPKNCGARVTSQRPRRLQRGAAALEFAIILPGIYLAVRKLVKESQPVDRFVAMWALSSLAMYAYLG